MISILITILVVVLLYKLLVYFFSLVYGRNDIADVSWGITFLIIASITLIYTDNYSLKFLVIFLLTLIWGTRVSARILLRNLKKKEDYRYARLRHGTKKYLWLRSLMQIYLLQGVLAIVVSLPIIVAGVYGSTFDIFSLLGLIVWSVGFYFETVGDYQLDTFKKNPSNHGKILKTGLWRFSRHPNYFGEITMWWGIFMMCLNLPFVWVAVVGPVTITFLIVFVSGIPMLERKKKGDAEFEEYKKKTSVLIPLPPKK